MCYFVKQINNFWQKFSEGKECKIKRGVKLYYVIKDKITVQQKIFYGKERDKLLEEQNDYRNRRNTNYKELIRSYAELENKLKAFEEKVTIFNSEIKIKYLETMFIANHRKPTMQQTNRTFILMTTFGV